MISFNRPQKPLAGPSRIAVCFCLALAFAASASGQQDQYLGTNKAVPPDATLTSGYKLLSSAEISPRRPDRT